MIWLTGHAEMFLPFGRIGVEGEEEGATLCCYGRQRLVCNYSRRTR